MNIGERLDALTMSLELGVRESEAVRDSIIALRGKSEQDDEHIRALARIAEIHERRLTRLEGTE